MAPCYINSTHLLCLLGLTLLASPAVSQNTVVINPVKDNTLYEDATGSLSNGKGTNLFAGKTSTNGSNKIRRALIKFDVAAIVPAGAIITAATLTMRMDKTTSGLQNVSMHTVTADWGEGNSNALASVGRGTTAQINDATWLHRFFSSTFWTTPGGDFTSTPSASTSVNSPGNYSWASTALTANVQSWLDNPSANFGLIVIGNEAIAHTAKRFVSREGVTADRPKLSITYTQPCTNPSITSFIAAPNSVCENGNATLTVNGSLNNATAWHLYSGSCGGTAVTSNTTGSFNVSPSATTTYFVRGEGGCVTPGSCSSVTVTTVPFEDPSFNYSAATYCQDGVDPTPTITGASGGVFSSTPGGLSINSATGEIDLSASTLGNYVVRYQTQGQCPDFLDVELSVDIVFNTSATKKICNGQQYVFGTQTLTSAGDYSQVFQSQAGCDSTVSLTLIVNPVFTQSASRSICQGKNYVFGTQTLTTAGMYSELFQSKAGCDSTVNLTLTVKPTYTTPVSATICSGNNYLLGTQTLTTAGLYSEVFQSKAGCDSTVNLTLSVTTVNTDITQTGLTLTAAASGASYQWLDCLNANQPIANETGKSFTANATGSYAVRVTENSCTDVSACTEIVVVGIGENGMGDSFYVYPNPTQEKVLILFEKVQPLVITHMTDLSGKSLSKKSFENCLSAELDIRELSAGIYLLQVQSGQNKKITRIMIR